MAHPCLPSTLQRKKALVILRPLLCPAPTSGSAGQGPFTASFWLVLAGGLASTGRRLEQVHPEA